MTVIVEYLEDIPAAGGRRQIHAGEKFDVTTLARAKHFHPEAVVRTIRGARYLGPGSLHAYTETGESLGMITLEGDDLVELELLVAAEEGLSPDPAAVVTEEPAGDSGAGDDGAGSGESSGDEGEGDDENAPDASVDAQDGAGAAEGDETAADTTPVKATRSTGSKKAKGSNVGTATG